MKNICSTLVLLILLTGPAWSQDVSLLDELMQEQSKDSALLPPKMLLTQRVLWGQKGLMRISGLAPLNTEARKRELDVRRFMLKSHQVLGFITLGGMVAQGIVGSRLYNGKYNLKDAHENLAVGVNLTYSLGAVTSLLVPPPLINRDKKITSLRLHKWLAIAHMSGMIATNLLSDGAEDSLKSRSAHRTAALFTFASFAAAMVVIKF